MREASGGRAEAAPAAARMAAARAGIPDPDRALVLGFRPGDSGAGKGGEDARAHSRIAAGWAERRHLILRCGPDLSPEEAVARLAAAGVSAETPALLASGLGTARERLFYGSAADVGIPGLGEEAVLVVPHPGALPMGFAWPPTAAPAEA